MLAFGGVSFNSSDPRNRPDAVSMTAHGNAAPDAQQSSHRIEKARLSAVSRCVGKGMKRVGRALPA